MRDSEYRRVLDSCGAWVALTPSERGECLESWRAVYAARLYERTGGWQHDGFEWHVFSFEFARALNGEKAVRAYETMPLEALVVVPEDGRLEAALLKAAVLPCFRALRGDVIVCPRSLEWTMAFTHEESLGLGPYFSRREWIGYGSTR